jgi:glycosyltransferase involved in cell wall biosynthesis
MEPVVETPGERHPGPVVAHVTAIDYSLRHLLLDQMKAIGAAGYSVLGVSRRGPDVPALVGEGVRHGPADITRRVTPLADLRAFVQLVRLFRRERPAIVHTHTAKAALLGQYAALVAGVPIRVHTIHGLYLPAGLSRVQRRALLALERLSLAFAHHAFSQSPEDVAVAIAERICAPDRIEHLGNGIDLARFDPARFTPADRARVRAELGVAPGDVLVGTVARLVAEKGYLDLFAAARRVRATHPHARFVFVGPFDREKKDVIAPDALARHGIADVARFLGHRDDVDALYAAMDVFALPSYREGFPRAPMEAAAMGLPAIVTDTRGCRSTVEHERTGLLVPVGDPRRLADALGRLIGDPAGRAAMGAAARAKAVAEFDQRRVFAQVLAAYERLRAGEVRS